MIKTVMPGDYDWSEPQSVLIDTSSRGLDGTQLQKRAAAGIFKGTDIVAEKNCSVVHLIAMGDSEVYSQNRNGDIFYGHPCEVEFPEPKTVKRAKIECGNADRIWTWTKHAKVFRDHLNKPTDKSYGKVIKAAHNAKMARVELLITVPNDDPVWHDDIEKLASGDALPFSMSCFPAGTLVRTDCGLRPIEQLEPGDMVWTHAGRYRKVSALMERQADAICRIDVVGMAGIPMYVTPEHPIYAAMFENMPRQQHRKHACPVNKVFRRAHRDELHRHLVWTDAEELSPKHYVAMPIPRDSGTEIDARWARLMGYYMAEGSLLFNGPKASTALFTVHRDDVAVAEIERLAEWTSVTYATHRLSDKCIVINGFGSKIAGRLHREVGRATAKRVPPSLFSASTASKLEFIVGWFNGDGWQDKGGLHWSTVELTRALDLQLLLASVGVPASITVNRHKEETVGRVIRGSEHEYVVTSSNELSGVFAAVAGCKATEMPIIGSSKRRAFISGDYLMLPVRGVEYVDCNSAVYNIAVEGDESYTAHNLAVHNCRIKHDVCTICGNFASKKSEYCDHIKHNITALTKSGHRVGMINDHMIFFDISRVRVPADRIAYSLMKVANYSIDDLRAQHVFIPPTLTTADDPYNIFKTKESAALRKLSEIEKRIEADGTLPMECAAIPAAALPGLPDALKTMLGDDRPRIGSALAALADVKVTLSLPDFAKVVLGSAADGIRGSIDSASDMLPGVFTRMLDSDTDLPESIMPAGDNALIPQRMLREIATSTGGMSLDDAPVARRMTVTIIRANKKPEIKKQANVVDDMAKKVLYTYAAYKMAWCERNGLDSQASKRAVLQHYISC
jgi:hypothetical protein